MARTYELISSTTVSVAALNVTFSSIPSTYTDLVLIAEYSRSGGGNNISMRFNSDSGSNYSEKYGEGDTSTYASGSHSSDSLLRVAAIGGGTGTGRAYLELHIMSYANTNVYKPVLSRYSEPGTINGFAMGMWRSTSAISTIDIGLSALHNWAVDSVLSLYGIKGA